MTKKLNKALHITYKTIRIIVISTAALLLLYSVSFSIAGTYAIYKAYHLVREPLDEIMALTMRNPEESAYMKLWKANRKDKNLPDSLSHIFTPIDSVSKHLIDAVLAAEDDGFWVHPGFDINAILSAYQNNISRGKIKRGGSTITQQTAKNIFLTSERSFDRKIRELAYTILIEKYWGKKRILEMYLNYAEWGDGIFGCEAASLAYFGKSSSKLSREQAIRLAAILASPNRLSPNASGSQFMSSRIGVIANNLFLHKKINDSDYFNITGHKPIQDSLLNDSTATE